MEKIILIRHGQTDWNLENRIQGNLDIPLNEKGIKQANYLSEGLTRALKTAEILSSKTNINLEIDNNLEELNFGKWQGLLIDEIRTLNKINFEKWMLKPANTQIPLGETLEKQAFRLNHSLEMYNKTNSGDICIVSHGTTIKILILMILGINLNYYINFKIDNCSISIIDFKERKLLKLNDTNHLKEFYNE